MRNDADDFDSSDIVTKALYLGEHVWAGKHKGKRQGWRPPGDEARVHTDIQDEGDDSCKGAGKGPYDVYINDMV